MLARLIIILIGLGGGAVAGGALAAFITLIRLIPQMVQMTKTRKFTKLYQSIFTLGIILFTIGYFTDSHLGLNKIVVAIVGILTGMFVGLFSSALAEVLHVIPNLSNKLKMRKNINLIVYALLFGRLAGSIFYWIYF